MAFGNWRDYLRGREEVSLKKYLYVFRPLLACRWIERQLGQVPILFAQLVEGVLDEADVRAALAELVARKQAGEELAVAPPVEALSRFIEAKLARLEEVNEPDDAAGKVEELNGFFRRYARKVRKKAKTRIGDPFDLPIHGRTISNQVGYQVGTTSLGLTPRAGAVSGVLRLLMRTGFVARQGRGESR